MRIVVVSDLHLDWVTAGFERFADLSASLDKVVDRVIETKVDLFVCLGDVCDPGRGRSHRAVAKCVAVASKLREHGIASYWLAGNHDVVEDGSGTTVLEPLKEAGFPVIDQPYRRWDNHKGPRLVWLPFTPASHSYDPVKYVSQIEEVHVPTIVFGHLNLEGIGPGSETKDLPRGRSVFWPTAALKESFPDALLVGGHYHEPQTFDGVTIVGSLGNLTRADDFAPQYLEIEI